MLGGFSTCGGEVGRCCDMRERERETARVHAYKYRYICIYIYIYRSVCVCVCVARKVVKLDQVFALRGPSNVSASFIFHGSLLPPTGLYEVVLADLNGISTD